MEFILFLVYSCVDISQWLLGFLINCVDISQHYSFSFVTISQHYSSTLGFFTLIFIVIFFSLLINFYGLTKQI